MCSTTASVHPNPSIDYEVRRSKKNKAIEKVRFALLLQPVFKGREDGCVAWLCRTAAARVLRALRLDCLLLRSKRSRSLRLHAAVRSNDDACEPAFIDV